MTERDRTADTTDEDESRLYSGEALETEDGVEVPRQMNVGKDNMEGGGEWPDPETPPREPAPGAVLGERPPDPRGTRRPQR